MSNDQKGEIITNIFQVISNYFILDYRKTVTTACVSSYGRLYFPGLVVFKTALGFVTSGLTKNPKNGSCLRFMNAWPSPAGYDAHIISFYDRDKTELHIIPPFLAPARVPIFL